MSYILLNFPLLSFVFVPLRNGSTTSSGSALKHLNLLSGARCLPCLPAERILKVMVMRYSPVPKDAFRTYTSQRSSPAADKRPSTVDHVFISADEVLVHEAVLDTEKHESRSPWPVPEPVNVAGLQNSISPHDSLSAAKRW